MADKTYKFYECENPDCNLRFPGYEGYPRWNKCPNCRSDTRIVVNSIVNWLDQPKLQPDPPIHALLDNIRSALNVGSIFRTSDGIGISQLYCCGITPSPDNPKVGKAALGSQYGVPWSKYNNGLRAAIELKSRGYLLWALESVPGSIPLFQVEIPGSVQPIVLIVGNEIAGVDPGIIDISHKVITIPMLGSKQSYNVAVAFGIATSYLLYRQSCSQGSRNILPKT
jgi:tRNA G18 (ribose-2'-O)-methylase SpoU